MFKWFDLVDVSLWCVGLSNGSGCVVRLPTRQKKLRGAEACVHSEAQVNVSAGCEVEDDHGSNIKQREIILEMRSMFGICSWFLSLYVCCLDLSVG